MSTAKMARASEKLDLYKVHKAEYAAQKDPAVLKIGKAQYLAMDGRGEPGGAAFEDAIGALYTVAFTIKMTSKAAGRDYAVAKLEAQWWLDSGHDFLSAPKDTWNWRLLLRTPDFIGAREYKAAQAALTAKGKPVIVREVRLMTIDEGMCVQVLHTGSYDREMESICGMHDCAERQGYQFHGLHHEIYLSDPRKTAAGKLRTILRMPVRK